MGKAFRFVELPDPAPVLGGIRERSGDICNPRRNCFTYRFCALNERYFTSTGRRHHPRQSPQQRLEVLRGERTAISLIFSRPGATGPGSMPRPPGINLGQNMLYHEYELVRGDARRPHSRNRQGRTCEKLAAGWRGSKTRGERSMRATLESTGWREEPNARRPGPSPPPPPDGTGRRRSAGTGPLLPATSPRRLSASA